MAMNPDFRDLFFALCAEGAEFLVVDAHAVMFHTTQRYTKDIDVWVRPSRDNAAHVHRALVAFGTPMADLTVRDLEVEGTIFQIGLEPNRIDVVTAIDGVKFEDAWSRRVPTTSGGIEIHVLSITDLLTNKRMVGRPQDLVDVDNLERRLRIEDSG
jgi:hypothetical protein